MKGRSGALSSAAEEVLGGSQAKAPFHGAAEEHPTPDALSDEAIVTVDLHTGLRKGELLGLTWEQVDFARSVIVLGRPTKSVMRGGSLVKLQAILGHASIRTTQVYAHLAPDHLGGATAILEGLGTAEINARSTHEASRAESRAARVV